MEHLRQRTSQKRVFPEIGGDIFALFSLACAVYGVVPWHGRLHFPRLDWGKHGHQVLILEADDPTPDGHLIPDGPTLLPEIDAIMERLARDAQQ